MPGQTEQFDELTLLADKYGADKSPTINHQYTPFYYELFKDKRNEFKKIVEVGVGNDRIFKYIPHYQIGASLRMWRDFFPNAMVYGADIEKTSMFKDDRIETILIDERKKEDIMRMLEITGTDIDLFIDDGSHHIDDQWFLLETVMPLLNKGVIYIIEDCGRNNRTCRRYPQWNGYVPVLPINERKRAFDKLVILTK